MITFEALAKLGALLGVVLVLAKFAWKRLGKLSVRWNTKPNGGGKLEVEWDPVPPSPQPPPRPPRPRVQRNSPNRPRVARVVRRQRERRQG